MGFPMATNLVEAGYSVSVYNRTTETAKKLGEKGAKVAHTPYEVAADSDIVISMLPNDSVEKEIVLGEEGILTGLKDNNVHLSMSTLSPDCADELSKALESVNAYYVAAPVLGRPDVAAAGELNICIAGDAAAKKRLQPVLEILGQRVYDFGEEASRANVVKLCVNFSIAAAIESMSEAFALAEKSGIDRTQIYQLFSETLFNCPIYNGYGKSIAEQDHDSAGFKLELGLKDITLALQAGHNSQTPMPIGSLVRDRLLSALAKGRGDLDWSALALESSEAAGIRQPD